MLPSCIMPYEPHILNKDINKFVVSGQVTDNNEYQIVSISKASSVDEPQYIPVSDCYVRIFDDKGNEFVLQESSKGIYRVRIDRNYLIPGTSFKVEVLTADGISIESDFDQMYECPQVDSVYYARKEIQTNNSTKIKVISTDELFAVTIRNAFENKSINSLFMRSRMANKK